MHLKEVFKALSATVLTRKMSILVSVSLKLVTKCYIAVLQLRLHLEDYSCMHKHC